MTRVAGNIFHHSLEMLLKSELGKHAGLDDLKANYGHKLDKLWRAIKESHPGDGLDRFDRLIAELDRFETVRYPNDYMKHGAAFSIDWSPLTLTSEQQEPSLPRYALRIADIDALVARLFQVCQMNPKYFWGGVGAATREAIEFQNNEVSNWL